jgi:hypothetical protein
MSNMGNIKQSTTIHCMNITAKPRIVAVAAGAAFCLFAQASFAVTLEGNPFRPTGANYTLTAVQGINPSVPLGATGVSPQVNRDFEFQGSTGVSYDTGGGTLKDFGLGLYTDSAGKTQSTGLLTTYDSLVTASSVTITVEDFDIKAGKDTSFNSGKVEPGIVIFGTNHSILASLTPAQIFPLLVANNSVPSGASGDTWDLNFGALLNSIHLADQNISGFLLYADQSNGEKASSDPYLLVSIGNGIPTVPEPGTYMVGLSAIALALFNARKALKKKTPNA